MDTDRKPRRDRLAAAMSWLANCIIAGFAAYGHAEYPVFTDPGEWPYNNPWLRDEPPGE